MGPADRLQARRDAILRREPLVRDAALELLELEAIHSGGQTDADAMLAMYSAATEQALADGHSGLRVAAEVTALVADPANHACHTRWESVADRYMASHPLAALCCYDRRALPAGVIGDLCAVHPVAHGPVAPFRLFAAPGALVVAGQVDYFSAGALQRALEAAADDGVALDLEPLGFADHHGMRALAESGLPLWGIPESMRRVCELLELAV